jgi:hypothetical protein
MQSPVPNLRYEKKFVAEGCSLAEVVARIRRHPAVFREAYPSRIVNNIYLDTHARRDYHAHINGAADRAKTRVRWYGRQCETPEGAMLERKLKRGMVSGKQAYALPRFSSNESGLHSQLGKAFDASPLPPILRLGLRHVEPALFNRYERHYFQSFDGKFRLTVDWRLQFASAQRDYRQTIDLSPLAKTVVLELKFGPESAADAEGVTNAWPFRMTRFSKYVVGIERV